MDGKEAEIFEMETGVKQGGSVSLLLFITMMDEIHKICRARTGRMKVGNWMMRPILCQALTYADDIVLIADTERKLQLAMDEWNETLEKKECKSIQQRVR